MTFTADLSTDVGKVRLLIPDRAQATAFFSDEEITALLDQEANTVFRAAALALEVMATDEAYVQKVIKLQDLSTNGAATATALMARATALRAQAFQAEQMETAGFDWAEQVPNIQAWRERIWDQRLRGAL